MAGNRVLRLLFSDGTAGDARFPGERWTGVLSPLNDPACLAEVTVGLEAGHLIWPGGIDLAPEPLYEQAKARPLLAARHPGRKPHAAKPGTSPHLPATRKGLPYCSRVQAGEGQLSTRLSCRAK